MFQMLSTLWTLLESALTNTQPYIDAYGELGQAAKSAAKKLNEEVQTESNQLSAATNGIK